MNLNQIVKELEQKAKQRDKKGIIELLAKIPELYPLLIDHTNLQVLKAECSKLEAKIKNWKWPSLTGKFYDKETLIKWAEGEPVPQHRTIINDIVGFAKLLRSFTKKSHITKEEANIKARPILKENPQITAKELGKQIGCSASLACKLPVWISVKGQLKKGRKPKVQRLTDSLLADVSAEDQAEIKKLTDEQQRDDKQRRVHPSI